MNLGVLPMIGGGPLMAAGPPANLVHVRLRQRRVRLHRQPGVAVPAHVRLDRDRRRVRLSTRRCGGPTPPRCATAVACRPCSDRPGRSFVLAKVTREERRRAPHPLPARRDPATASGTRARWRPSVKAIILAAGVARRLAPLTDRTHKCLLPVGGRPLLDPDARARSPSARRRGDGPRGRPLPGPGARGWPSARAGRGCGSPTSRIPSTPKGSALSLYAGPRHAPHATPTLVMDADVLLPAGRSSPRLIAAPAASALLLDRGFQDTGEEVKL